MTEEEFRLGVVAGEASGDILGAAAVAALRSHHVHLNLAGLGGERLAAQGLSSLYPMEHLSVMGLIEPLKRLPTLLKIRRDLYHQQIAWQPHVFMGVDSPDFNLTLERKLRQRGIKVAHLVSPSVWAWRRGRLKTIRESVDLMCCLLPFEVAIYEAAGIPASCVGHPLADDALLMPDRNASREALGLDLSRQWLAVLPGSRAAEVALLMPVLREAMLLLQAQRSDLGFVMPAANSERMVQIKQALGPELAHVVVIEGQGRQVLRAADCGLLASGTATLEAMYMDCPMVVAYRMSALSWQVISRMVYTEHVALPNILAGRAVVPELLQNAAQPQALRDAILELLDGAGEVQRQEFEGLKASIGRDFATRTARAIVSLGVR